MTKEAMFNLLDWISLFSFSKTFLKKDQKRVLSLKAISSKQNRAIYHTKMASWMDSFRE